MSECHEVLSFSIKSKYELGLLTLNMHMQYCMWYYRSPRQEVAHRWACTDQWSVRCPPARELPHLLGCIDRRGVRAALVSSGKSGSVTNYDNYVTLKATSSLPTTQGQKLYFFIPLHLSE